MEGKLGSGAFGTAFLVLDLKSNNEKWVDNSVGMSLGSQWLDLEGQIA